MANLWQMEGSGWLRRTLAGNYAVLGTQPEPLIHSASALPVDRGPVLIGRYAREDSAPGWILLSLPESHVWVNGRILASGLCVLRDRDEIMIGGSSRFYFSTEELAKVEPFPAGEGPVFCARCRQPVQPGTLAVRCPACGHWCEQSDAKPCWSYGPTCPLCEQPTAFDTGLRWTPEEL